MHQRTHGEEYARACAQERCTANKGAARSPNHLNYEMGWPIPYMHTVLFSFVLEKYKKHGVSSTFKTPVLSSIVEPHQNTTRTPF
eukprot:847516-Pelagomonas_calceolata.AAC.1